ncbi:MAG: hypothetical protein AAGJ18_22700 [Bacteroidota bacterium]
MEELEDHNFEVDWLNERYPFDAEARNKTLESKVLGHFDDQKEITFVDVGAGTGSNCLYFIDQLAAVHQRWYLVELNGRLSNATIRRFKDYASFHKYDFEKKKNRLTIRSQKKTLEIYLVNDSLLNLADLVDLKKVDLVLGNAVFDLFTAKQIKTFTQLLVDRQLSFYTTLTYESMEFLPADPFDEVFVGVYEEHMQRPQEIGNALGPKAGKLMVDYLTLQGAKVETGASAWEIDVEDIKMHYYLLNFMENALKEMDLAPAMMTNFERWTQRKKEAIMFRQQRLAIRHLDIFAVTN